MTWNRRLAVIGLFVVLVCVGVGLAMLLTPDNRPGVTKANFDRIEEGMTGAEVEAIFGISPCERTTLGGGDIQFADYRGDNGACAAIDFRNDVVIGNKTWTDSTETTWQRIRRWLRMPA